MEELILCIAVILAFIAGYFWRYFGLLNFKKFKHQVEASKVSDNEAKKKICRYYGECYWKSKGTIAYCDCTDGCGYKSD